jgi:hypothetical protein
VNEVPGQRQVRDRGELRAFYRGKDARMIDAELDTIQSVSGKTIPDRCDDVLNGRFAQVIADALHRDFGETHAAVKIVVGLTKANERAVKNWFKAKNGPTGRHLVDLVRISDEVLEAVLLMSGRQELVVAKKLADSKQLLIKMFKLIGELQGQPMSVHARDVIYAAFFRQKPCYALGQEQEAKCRLPNRLMRLSTWIARK